MSISFINEPFSGRPFNTTVRRQCFNVTIRDDSVPENDETFTVTIEHDTDAPSPSITVEPNLVTITIVDRDGK